MKTLILIAALMLSALPAWGQSKQEMLTQKAAETRAMADACETAHPKDSVKACKKEEKAAWKAMIAADPQWQARRAAERLAFAEAVANAANTLGNSSSVPSGCHTQRIWVTQPGSTANATATDVLVCP